VLQSLRAVDRHEPPREPPASLRWDAVLAFTEAERLAPALGFMLKERAPAAMPAAVRDRLRAHLVEATACHIVLSGELGRLLRHFGTTGIPVIPLKGPALAETLYPRPALRPASDLDLLIPCETLVEVDGALRDLGYRRAPDEHSWSFDAAFDRATVYEGPAGVRADVHWSFVSDPRYSWNEGASRAVWDRAVRIRVAGEDALGLGPEDLLLYLALHLAVHHGLAGLLWYWDLARLLQHSGTRLDWTAVVERAARWRVVRVLAFVLRGVEDLFGPSVPAPVMARLAPHGPRAGMLRWLQRHGDGQGRTRLEHLLTLLLVDRTLDLAAPLWRVACPSAAWLRARYESAGPSRARQYLAHYHRLAQVIGRTAAGLARRINPRG
jgi:hypothetical protein